MRFHVSVGRRLSLWLLLLWLCLVRSLGILRLRLMAIREHAPKRHRQDRHECEFGIAFHVFMRPLIQPMQRQGPGKLAELAESRN